MKSATDKKPQEGTLKTTFSAQHEIKTDFPLSEKDEVKQAEEKVWFIFTRV